MNKFLITFCAALFFSLFTYSQYVHHGQPLSKLKQLSGNIPVLNAPKTFTEADETVTEKNGGALKFAHEIELEFDFFQEALLTKTSSGDKIYRVSIKSAGAKSLGLFFKHYYLPKGAKLFVYNNDYSQIVGALTHKNNKSFGSLAITQIEGDIITLEYQASQIINEKPKLIIGTIYHDFLGIVKNKNLKDQYFGDSGSCNVDINCEAGDAWQIEKHSVCRLTAGGQLCTGALINNTEQDGKAYFLTAHHCIRTISNASSAIFIFNYESPSCQGPDGSTQQQISGSTLKATSENLDFSLVELSIVPPSEYQPFYAGWESSTSAPKNATSIHHPSGDVKKISKENDILSTGNYGNGLDFNTHWWIQTWELGTTEGGSSGSPLFNEDHRIVGVLTGGQASCSNNVNDYYQKFDAAWDDYSTADEQLKAWLDDNNTGLTSIDGFDPYYGSNPPVADFVASRYSIVEGSSVDFFDMSSGNPTAWSWLFEGASQTTSTAKYPTNIVYNTAGIYTVKLTVSNSNGSDSETKTALIEVSEGCDYASNILENESLTMYNFGTSAWGWWTGTNEYLWTEFADKFTNQSAHFVHGINVPVGVAYSGNSGSQVTFKIWENGSEPGTVIGQKTVNISSLQYPSWNYIAFSPPVETDGSFYVGYEITYNAVQDSFAVFHSPQHGSGGSNTTYVFENGSWSPIYAFNENLTISLGIEPYVCGSENTIVENSSYEIMIYPNPANNFIEIQLKNTNNNSRLDILNIIGKTVFSETLSAEDFSLRVDCKNFPNGLYFVRIQNDNASFEQKIIINH